MGIVPASLIRSEEMLLLEEEDSPDLDLLAFWPIELGDDALVVGEGGGWRRVGGGK
jgi:hypothetical protein